jgi:hypothetical protein
MRDGELRMPVIAPIEDLKAAPERNVFYGLVFSSCNLRLTTYGQWEMAPDRVEKRLQASAGRKDSGAVKRGRRSVIVWTCPTLLFRGDP